jgi:L-alanine-DL-glutamate epimerase-like enolase superfamily enzyme
MRKKLSDRNVTKGPPTARRRFIKLAVATGAWTLAPKALTVGREPASRLSAKLDEAAAAPVLKTALFKQPVKIAAIELLRNGRQFLIRARSTDGAAGLSVAQREAMSSAYPILLHRVIPFFIGKDARELESLIHGVYLHDSNYKWQGLPFWVCVASVEMALLDLLGHVAGKSLGELLGGVRQREIAIYRASERRGNTPEQEIEYLQKLVAETGAKAIKFRLGARMRYDDQSTRRDESLIPLTRKVFGDRMTIYADANGSYDVPTAIKIGRLMKEHRLAFFEEPVPFDYYEETRQVTDALTIRIAGGEQESSLRRFRWMIENTGVNIVQPDLFYFGGLTRSIRVARMAAAAGMECTPHMSGNGLGWLYVAHFASCVPNAGPFQEYKGEEADLPVASETSSLKCEHGMIKVPTGPGLGVTIDPSFINQTTVVSA